MKKLVIFDFDGTLADTSPGILACHRHAFKSCGHTIPDEVVLRSIIGAPLLKSYIDTLGFNEEDARKAVSIYRERYAEKGIYEVTPYAGMLETLHELKRRGLRLGVATLKAHRFLEPMFDVLGFAGVFDVWHGMDERDGLTKAQLVRDCCADMKTLVEDAVLVGDSVFDQQGAEEVGIDFVGVSYGFGFNDREMTCHSPKQLVGRIFGDLENAQ